MRASLVLLLLVLCTPLRAETLPGSDDPAFVTARAQWLAGEDMAAVTALSALAQAGNPSAQLLLGSTEQSQPVPDELATLSRADRIALWRQPGGLSGKNWLVARADDLPLAAALHTSGNGSGLADDAGRRAALETLLAAGETRAAVAVLALANNQGGWAPDQGWDLVVRYGNHPALAGHGLPMVSMLHELVVNPATGVGTPKRVAVLGSLLARAEAPASDLAATRAAWSSRRTLEDAQKLAEAQAAAGEAPLVAPLRGLCAAACPKSTNACTFALLTEVGGIPGYVTLSPLESVIPSAEYQRSPRFLDDLRALLGSRSDTPAEQRAARHAHLARFDACAANLLHRGG